MPHEPRKWFWYIVYPLFAIPVLTTISAIGMLFEPKPAYPPKGWAEEEERRIKAAREHHE